MVDAIPALTTEKAIELFEKFGVFTKAELESRAEIQYESYAKAINIEARTMIDMASKQIIPAVIKYTKDTCRYSSCSNRCRCRYICSGRTSDRSIRIISKSKKALEALKVVTDQAAAMEEGEDQQDSITPM